MKDFEKIISLTLMEMAYPFHFSFEELKSLSSFAAKKRYCDAHLKQIGVGSSRIAYQVDDEKVLKLAKNAKGLAQNKREISVSSYDVELFAKTFEYEENGSWVEMELARKPKPTDIKKLLGVSLDMFRSLIYALAIDNGQIRDNYINRSRASEGHKFIEKWVDNEDGLFQGEWQSKSGMTEYGWDFFGEINNWLYYYGAEDSEIGDMQRLANWGIVKRNGKEALVLIDYGIDEEIYNQFYKR